MFEHVGECVWAYAGVVLYSWCARILKDCVREKELSQEEAQRIELNVGMVRGLAAKQIAYTLTQVSLKRLPASSRACVCACVRA